MEILKLELSRPGPLNGELILPPDEEYFYYCLFMASLSTGSTELLHFQPTPQIDLLVEWFHTLKIITLIEPETLVIIGQGAQFRPDYQDVSFELSRHTRVNVLFVEFLRSSDWPLVQFKGTSLHLGQLSDELSNLQGYILDSKEGTLDIQFEQPKELKSEYKFKQSSSIARDIIFLRCLLDEHSCLVQEPFAINDSFIQVMNFFGIKTNIDRQGNQELSELEKRLSRLRGIKSEKKSICSIGGFKQINAKQIRLPADPDIASALTVLGCLIPKSYFILKNVSVNPSRSGIFTSLKRLGFKVDSLRRKERQGDAIADIEVQFTRNRLARKIGGESMLSSTRQYPILAIAACYADGESILRDIPLVHENEIMRLHHLATNLKHTGAEIGEFDEGIVIRGREECDSNTYQAQGDEILALALYVLSRTTHGKSHFMSIDLIEKYFPSFIPYIELLEVTQASEE